MGLLAIAEPGPLDEFHRARVDLLRGQIAFASSRGSAAPPLLVKAARRLERLDPRLARETYLEALAAALLAKAPPGPGGNGLPEIAQRRRVPRPLHAARAALRPTCCLMVWRG